MSKPIIYQCKLCGEDVRKYALPKTVTDKELCWQCYQIKYMAQRDAIKEFIERNR